MIILLTFTNMTSLPKGGAEIHPFEKFGQPNHGTLGEALKRMLPATQDGAKKAAEILKKLERCHFPIHFVMAGERYELNGSHLEIIIRHKDGEKRYSLHLDADDATLKEQVHKLPFYGTRKGLAALQEEMGEDFSQRNQVLEQLCDNEILVEVRKFLNLPSSFSARKSDWPQVLERWDEVISSLQTKKGSARVSKLTADKKERLDRAANENYKGTTLQNLIFIEYYRLSESAKEPVIVPKAKIDTSPAVSAEKKSAEKKTEARVAKASGPPVVRKATALL